MNSWRARVDDVVGTSHGLWYACLAGVAVVMLLMAAASRRKRRRHAPAAAPKDRVVAISVGKADESAGNADESAGPADEEAPLLPGEAAGSVEERGPSRQLSVMTVTPSTEEKQKIQDLRHMMAQADSAAGIAGGERWCEDAELLRFVRARKTLAESEKLLREAMTWRREHAQLWGVDTSVTGSFGQEHARYASDPSAAPAWWSFLQKNLSMSLFGKDGNGLPILYHALGHDDLQGCVREVGMVHLQHYAVMVNDLFLDMARAATKQSAQDGEVLLAGHVIIDMDGLSLRHFGEAKVFNQISSVIKTLHPERMQRCFIVRAPRMFAAAFRLCQGMVDPRTVSKITVLGHDDSLEPLFDELGEDNVPDFLGGRNISLRKPSADLLRAGSFAKHQGGDAAMWPWIK